MSSGIVNIFGLIVKSPAICFSPQVIISNVILQIYSPLSNTVTWPTLRNLFINMYIVCPYTTIARRDKQDGYWWNLSRVFGLIISCHLKFLVLPVSSGSFSFTPSFIFPYLLVKCWFLSNLPQLLPSASGLCLLTLWDQTFLTPSDIVSESTYPC